MGLVENIKKYFSAKKNGEPIGKAPEGVCPNCWGKQEWEGHFYEKITANNITPENNMYNNFIHEVAEKLDKITLKSDTYECKTCQIKFED